MSAVTIESRLFELESREAIRQLVAKYCFVIDNRDIEGIAALMAPDARFRSKDGVMNATGRDAIIKQFDGRFSILGMTNHFTHDHLIELESPDRAHGTVNSHAELIVRGRPMWVSLRYDDTYVREAGRWYFGERLLTFNYYLDVEEYPKYLGERLRMRAYKEPQAADWPEGTDSWKAYAEAIKAKCGA
jgi:ketosteroid isomerase-like protein